MRWVDKDTAVSSDGTIYTIRKGGIVEISGDKWKTRWLPDGMPKYPNVTLNLKTKARARSVVKLIDKMIRDGKTDNQAT